MSDSNPKTVSDLLSEPFPQSAIKTRPGGGGKQLSYVEGHTVIHWLNKATGNNWDLAIRSIDTMQMGTKTLMRAHVALTIPGLGTREHIGVQAVEDRGGEDLVKGVVTDALKKAATLFGVGLDLYGPDYSAGEFPPLPNRDRSTSRNVIPEGVQATQTNGTAKPAQDVELMSRGQLNVIEKHQQDLGWSIDDMKVIVAAHHKSTIKEFTAQQARDLITVMADPAQADPYLTALRKPATQAQMIDTNNIAERARS